MAELFGLSPESIRKHLRGQVHTTQTKAILDHAHQHYTLEREEQL